MVDVENGTDDGGQGLPTPAPSATPVAPTSAVDESLKAELRTFITEEVKRAGQSVKDKRIAQLQGSVDDFEARLTRLQELQGKGMNQDQALLYMRMQDMVTPPQQPAAPIPPQGTDDYLKTFLAATGLSDKDAEVLDVLYRVSDPLAQVKELSDLAAKKRQAPLAPNPAAVLPTGGGAPVDVGDDLDALTEKLTRLQKEPLKNIQEIKRVSEQMRQKLTR